MTADRRLTVAVTGASGLVGRALCEKLAGRGHEVRALTRRRDAALAAVPHVTRFACDLPDVIDAEALSGCDAVVHAAYTTRATSIADARRVNEDGTARLLAMSRAARVRRFVFISSASAHATARSYYGQSKFRLERSLDPTTDLVIRPGLVVSATGGLFARMVGARTGGRRRGWLVPLFDGGRQPMQTILIDDLVEGIARALEQDVVGALTLASPERLTMRGFFQAIADFGDRRPRFVALPEGASLIAFRAAEALRLPLPVTSENLLGLLSLRYWETEADLARLGLRVRPLGESLASLRGA